jgi:hypothetical protein
MSRLERARIYARVKAIMILRKIGVLVSLSGLRLRRFRLPSVLAGAAIILMTLFAGASGAGVSNYQGTLYLDGAPSAVAGSFQLLAAAGPATPGTPVAVAGLSGSGSIPGGSGITYQYIYVVSSGGARTASAAAVTGAMPANGSATITAVDLVGSDLYRQRIVSGLPVNNYFLVKANVPTSPYVDTVADPVPLSSAAALPQADARVQTAASCATVNACGYVEFAPGVGYTSSIPVGPVTSTPSIPSTCKGWTVDATGGVSFSAGTWSFQVRVKANTGANGTAFLTVGMWKVNDAGAPVSGGTLIDPTQLSSDGSQNLIVAGTTQTITYTTPSNVPAFTLASNEHLCVQFWRHQTAPSSSGASQRTLSLLAYDPLNAITVHPAPNATPAATLASPADGLHTTSIPTLGATYSDAEPDAGNITIRLCSDSGCGTPLQNSGAMAATNGATLTWTPSGPLTDGTYYWQAQAQDAVGASAWSSSRSFVVDNAAPTTTINSSPPLNSNAASGSFSFSANEAVTGFQCRVDGASFASCTSPYAYGPLADGPHSFDVKATADLAGNPGTTTSYGWTIDTVAPDTAITSSPAALSNSASPSFGLSATQSGSTFQCSLDGAAFAACGNPATYSGLADGAHTFQARAVDPAGNQDPSPASYAWTIDATPPNTSIGPSAPASLTTATGATFDFSSSEPGSTFQCSLDGAAFAACSSPKTYSALADGSHTFQVRATDMAANTDPTPASYTWTIDTTPPVTSIGPTTPPANTSSAGAAFDLASNEAGSTFECRLDGASFASCTTPASYTGLGDGTHTFEVRATDAAGNVDTSPASYTWRIDNVAPSTAPVAPADTLATNTLPQLRASFDDASAGGDTGTVQFQLCSSSAPAGTACAPLVQSVTSSAVTSGGTAGVTPAALPDGTYHWQARATDAAGNQSGWTATRSFQLDTSVPAVPSDASPADGAWVRTVQLSGTFSKPAFAGTGSVEFRICMDALCLTVVTSGSSGTLVNGGVAGWSPVFPLGDGLYYWQTRGVDSVGNQSSWSAARVLHVDTHAPGQPLNFNGTVATDGLTLRWDPPDDVIANYVLFVDGAPYKNLGSTEHEVKMGPFAADDTRTFSVVAVDLAGNVGAMSSVLVGVPDLTGLTWTQAVAATSARGLALRRNQPVFASVPMLVKSQQPVVPAVAAQGSAVLVTLAPREGAPLAMRVKPGRFVCAGGSTLRLRVELSEDALVRKRLLNARGRVVNRGTVGTLRAGTTRVRVKLPRTLRGGAYRLVFDASGSAGQARALVRVKVGLRGCRGR